jgi:hypothetical protein
LTSQLFSILFFVVKQLAGGFDPRRVGQQTIAVDFVKISQSG